MTLYYGADSQTRTTFEVPARRMPDAHRPAGGGAQTLYTYITGRLRGARPRWVEESQLPRFWGRYLNRGDHRDRGPLTRDEANDIFVMSGGRCRILPIYNGSWRRQDRVTGPNARHNGRRSAEEAIDLASPGNLGIPQTVRLYADLERWRVDREWFLGWMEVMYQSDYPGVGGFYGNPAVWGSFWRERNGVRRRVHEGWRRNLGPAAERFGDRQFDAVIDALSRRDGAIGPSSPVAKIWSNRPYLNQPGTEMAAGTMYPREFRAEVTPASFMVETVIWQYGAQIPFGLNGFASVDLNLAKESAFNEMWGRQ